MENRLKERLTGAAILVALIVLIVPEVFRGRPTGAQPTVARASHALQAPEGAPVRSYTIDLNGAGAPPSAPELVAPPAAAVPAAAAGAAATASGKVSAKVSARAPGKAPTRAPTAAPLRRAAALGAAAGPAGPAGAVGAAHAKTSGEGGWSVQLGLFSKAHNATRLAQTAHGKGFAVHVSRSTRGLYRVALVGLADRAAALRALRRLKAAGLPAAIMRPR